MVTKVIKNNSEYLYLFETLIDHVTLMPNVLKSLSTSDCLRITVKLGNLPVLTVHEDDFALKNAANHRQERINFASGESNLFTCCPEEFRSLIKNRTVTIGVYKEDSAALCSDEDPEDTMFIGGTDVILHGCVCGQLKLVENECNHFPQSLIELKKNCDLLDSVKNISATVNLNLKISCLGKSIVHEFKSSQTSLLFKNIQTSSEFECSWMLPNGEVVRKKPVNGTKLSQMSQEAATPQIKTIVGLSTVCENLPGGPVSFSESLARQKLPLSSEDELKPPETVKTDEKMEETMKKNCHEQNCPSILTYNPFGVALPPTINDNNNIMHRLRGGGKESAKTPDNSQAFAVPSIQTLISGVCKGRSASDNKPGCRCFGKSAYDTSGCLKKPCQGINCLIRALKNTQEFVDSIGKVPGLAGLGLMDPTDSPFFNRHHDDLPTTCSPMEAANSLKPSTNDNYTGFKSHFNSKTTAYHNLTSRPTVEVDKTTEYPTENREQLLLPLNNHPSGDNRNGESSSQKQSGVEHNKNPTERRTKSRQSRWSKSMQKRRQGKFFSHQPITSTSHNEVRVSKRVKKMVESAGSGMKRYCFGHRACVDVTTRVPGNMGWLWNSRKTSGKTSVQIGWKPGAILRRVWKLLEDAKIEKTEDVPERPVTPIRGKKSKSSLRRRRLMSGVRSPWSRHRDRDDEFELPPVLHIHRKDGTYYITMYPMKKEFINNPELQETVKPLQFKVTKDKDNESTASSSIAPDMEFEFSPPVAMTRWRKKPETKEFSSQIEQQEIVDALVDAGPVIQVIKKIPKKRFH